MTAATGETLPLGTTQNDAGNLREQTLRRLRSDIMGGRIGPGTLLSVPALSAELGVSTTPIREALLTLARDNLVTPLRNRGFRVEPMSIAALENLFSLRELLEVHAIVAIARKGLLDTSELIALADAVGEAVSRADVPGYVATDRAFHTALVARAGNPLLTQLVLQLRDGMRLYGIDSPEGLQRQRDSVAEHYQLVELSQRGDVDSAATLMSRHIVSWKPLFMAALASHDEKAGGVPSL